MKRMDPADPRSCGYNISNLVITGKQGCINRGFGWSIPSSYFGFPLPDDINYNLSRVAVTSVVGECVFRAFGHCSLSSLIHAAFAFVLASGLHHAYAIRYSYRLSPAPNEDKMYTLVQIHLISVGVCFMYVLLSRALPTPFPHFLVSIGRREQSLLQVHLDCFRRSSCHRRERDWIFW